MVQACPDNRADEGTFMATDDAISWDHTTEDVLNEITSNLQRI